MNRYHRQELLPQIGEAGQRRLRAARVLIVGCGALGSVLAEQLVRAGVGHLIVADRDVVELTNLQRQVLFDEQDVRDATPKAVAAARRLSAINSEAAIEARVTDVQPDNLEELAGAADSRGGPTLDLLLDGTDNVATRYLINDVAVKHGIPWVYGACVGTEGRVMPVLPGRTPCLRCVFPMPPDPTTLQTCDTAGVLGPVVAVVAALQAVAAMKILTGQAGSMTSELLAIDGWAGRFRPLSLTDSRDPECPCCGRQRFEFLEARGDSTVSLCGRNAVQVRRPGGRASLDLAEYERRLGAAGRVERTPYLLRCALHDPAGVQLTLFPDGRMIAQGTRDPARAAALYARFIGA